MAIDAHKRTNWHNWEDRVPVHAASQDYSLARYRDDPTFLSRVVRYDADRLGPLTGLDVVHLQCHIGTDTVSLARLGAATTTGYDFSPSAVETARRLAVDAGANAEFVEGELYDAPGVLGRERFDLVYTGTGAINWLPDIRGWARVVAALLRPGGRLHLREGHPMMWSLDEERDDGVLAIKFPYFERAEPMLFDEGAQTYTDGDASGITHTATAEWNHGLGEIVQAVLDAGLVLTGLIEHQECEWEALPHLMQRDPDGYFRLIEQRERLPLMFTLQAQRSAG